MELGVPGGSSLALLKIPAELRLKIFRYLFTDLIDELSDNLFAVFQIYDHMYDYTGSYLESHVGRTGLTPILYTCKQIHDEALPILCELSEFVVNLGGDDDSDDEERISVRLSQLTQHLRFARNLKLNLLPKDDVTNERFLRRLDGFLDAIHHGENLRSLKILINVDWHIGSFNSISRESLDLVLAKLEALKTQGHCITIYLGKVSEEQISNERLTILLDTIGGYVSDKNLPFIEGGIMQGTELTFNRNSMGRDHPDLAPSYWDDDEESEAQGADSEAEGDSSTDKN